MIEWQPLIHIWVATMYVLSARYIKRIILQNVYHFLLRKPYASNNWMHDYAPRWYSVRPFCSFSLIYIKQINWQPHSLLMIFDNISIFTESAHVFKVTFQIDRFVIAVPPLRYSNDVIRNHLHDRWLTSYLSECLKDNWLVTTIAGRWIQQLFQLSVITYTCTCILFMILLCFISYRRV